MHVHVRNTILVKFVVFIVALQVLNMSIDIPAYPKETIAAKNFNYIDTYIEYIAENILKLENAIPEAKHRHQKHFRLHPQIQMVCEAPAIIKPPLPERLLKKVYSGYSNQFAYQFIKEIHPPPPKLS